MASSSKDMSLHSPWRVFADVGSPKPDDMLILGSFQTLLGFWKFWNGMGEKTVLDKLPRSINLRMFRQSVRSVPNEENYVGVSFVIEPKHSEGHELFVGFAMAVVGERLTNQVNGLIFRRAHSHVTITIWAETDITQKVQGLLATIFESPGDYILTKKPHGRAERSALMSRPGSAVPTSTPLDMDLIRQYAHDPDARVLPQDLASFDWNTLYSLSRQFDSMTITPGGEAFDTSRHTEGSLPWDDATAEQEVHRWLGQVIRFFEIRPVKSLPHEYNEIITAEGCPVCFQGHDPDGNQSYVTLRCLILQCQHVLHWNCLSRVPTVSLRHYHSTAFFRNDELSHEELIALQNVPRTCARGTRRIRLGLEVHHLLSSQCDVTIPATQELETFQDAVTHDEFSLILFGRDSMLHFPVRRARVVCKVFNTQTNQVFEHDVNYDIPLEKQKNLSTNKPFRMIYTDDEQSRNSLVICVQRQIVMVNGQPTPRFAIVCVQYVFSKDSRLSVQVPGAMSAPVIVSPVTGFGLLSPVGPGNQIAGTGYGTLSSPTGMYSQTMAGAPAQYSASVPQYSTGGGTAAMTAEQSALQVVLTPPMIPTTLPASPTGALSPMAHLTSPQMNPYQLAAAAQAAQAAPQYPPQYPAAPPSVLSPASAAIMSSIAQDQSGLTSPVYVHPSYQHNHNKYGQHHAPPQQQPPMGHQQQWHGGGGGQYVHDQMGMQQPPQQYDMYNEPKQMPSRRGGRGGRRDRRRGGGGGGGGGGFFQNFFGRKDNNGGNGGNDRGGGGGRMFGRFRGRGRGRQQPPTPETPEDKSYGYNYPTPQSTNSDSKSFNAMSPHTPSMIDHVVGRVYYLAKSQSGSRFVQEKLTDPQYFEMFFLELQSHVADLMMDNFGHYAIEALFNQCDNTQRLTLLGNLTAHMATVACHKQGSFSIQAMMENLGTEAQINMLSQALKRDIRKIILNNSGHYVILRFLQRYEYPHTKFIHRALTQYTLEFATDHYGLRVMKTAVDTGPTAEMQSVFTAIVKITNTLVENQYGNYIVQHLLDIGPSDITDLIKEKMHGKFVRYSKQKFSSNVVEKCLRHSSNEMKEGSASKDWRTLIVCELLGKSGELISDKYGNYCLQTALQASKSNPELLHQFKELTKPHLASLRENVRTKWIKLLQTADEQMRDAQMMGMPPQQFGHAPGVGYPPGPRR